jgi:hypothetical protein
MHKLHATTGPNRASGPELLFCTCFTSIPAPFAIIGKLSAFRDYALETLLGRWCLAATRLESACIQSHSAGASVFSTSVNLAFGGE